jgi:hypothetical protein
MKSALSLLLSFAAVSFAADPQSVNDPPPADKGKLVKKLGSVTWDLDAHRLVWVVQKGTIVNEKFVLASEERYEISPGDAIMAASGEKRGFAASEADSLQKLLDVLSLYCAESVVWWDQGEGTPVDPGTSKPSGRPGQIKPKAKPGERPVRVQDQQPAEPVKRVPDRELVAALAGRL